MSKYGIAKCGHESNRSKIECANCARKRYCNSSEIIKEKIKTRNGKWEKQNREKRNKIVYKWQDKITARQPEALKELRRAIKRLEGALAYANEHERISEASK